MSEDTAGRLDKLNDLSPYGHVLPHQQDNAAGPMETQIFGDSIPTPSPRAQKNEMNGEIVNDGKN